MNYFAIIFYQDTGRWHNVWRCERDLGSQQFF